MKGGHVYSSSVKKYVYYWWIATDSHHANAGNCKLYNALSKRLSNDLCSSNAMKWVKVQLSRSKPFLFSSNISLNLINTTPPASNSIYRQNFMWKSLEIIIKHSCLTFGDMAYFFHTNHAGHPVFHNFITLGSLQFVLEDSLTFCNGKGIYSRNVLIGLIEN